MRSTSWHFNHLELCCPACGLPVCASDYPANAPPLLNKTPPNCHRARVFEMRARSDAVIVGGNTVRRDNPSLTTRR